MNKKSSVPTDILGGKSALDAQMHASAMGGQVEFDIDKNLQQSFVDMTHPHPLPEFRLNIGGVGVLPKGGIVVVSGDAKQGKTQFITAMVSVLLSGRNFGSMMRGSEITSHALWIDTEQSLSEIQSCMNRIYKHAGIPEFTDSREAGLPTYSLRPYTPEQRVQLVSRAIELRNPDVLVIDGVRDLLYDINDPTESVFLSTWLLQTATAYPDMTIVIVLHTNKSNDNLRGHIGTEIMNKCSDRFTCKKQNGCFTVTHTGRNMEMQRPFSFKIDNGELRAIEADEAAGVVDKEAVFASCVPADGAMWADIVKAYKKASGCSQSVAAAIVSEKAAVGVIVQPEKKGRWFLAESENTPYIVGEAFGGQTPT